MYNRNDYEVGVDLPTGGERMKRLVKGSLAVALAAAMMLTGCDKSGGDEAQGTAEGTMESSAVETPSETEKGTEAPTVTLRDVVAPETDYVTEAMFERAMKYDKYANNKKLADLMLRAEKGEDITVGVIGGSITQGSSATKPQNTYSQIMWRWWQATFPDSEITFVNAGIGATTSYLGVHRVEKDLLASEPDFVIVEFAVNDANTDFFKISYDNLVRRILTDENSPAVMLVFMTQESGTSAQANCSFVGVKYGLPMISYREAVLDEIKAGAFTWKDISPDNIHPNDKGHAMLGEMIWKYLNDVYENVDTYTQEEVLDVPAEGNIPYKYANGKILDNTNLTPDALGSFTAGSKLLYDRFHDGWTTTAGVGEYKITVEAKNIGIIYGMLTSGKGGTFDIYVDGEKVTSINSDFTGGWGNYAETKEIISFETTGTHVIEVKKADGSAAEEFVIMGWLIS